jgi:ATP-binding cassette subfamily B protein
VIALVGANGAGKSTLVRLLCRLCDPTSGSIRIDGVDLRDLRISDLRLGISVLFQDFARYHFTARENVWFGDTRAPADRDRIERAAQAAGAHEFIAGLPGAYDTTLGRLLDDGEELSTGQWKKLALARALFRPAPILVLDEPFDAMDPEAESRLMAEVRRAARSSAVLVISHRLAVSRWADSVVVLADGTVAEIGSHDDLLRTGGAYRDFYRGQARHYQDARPA